MSTDTTAAPATVLGVPCVKCRVEDAVTRVRDAAYCRNCFIHQMIGKVRIHLTKNKLPGDFREARGKCRILIAVSGGPSSRAMLDIVAQYNGEVTNEQARRFGGLHIAHIDEQALGHPSFKASPKQVASWAESYGIEQTTLPLEGAFAVDETEEDGGKGRMMECISVYAKNGQSAVEDLLLQVRLHLLRQIALQAGCSIIVTGENSTRTSINTLLEIANGRGFVLPLLVSPTSSVGYKDTVVWRPMRDCLAKEVDLFNAYKGIPVVASSNVGSSTKKVNTLRSLTEDFIVSLDESFPATASTVTRTAGKLKVAPALLSSTDHCVLCALPIQEESHLWRERCAILTKDEQVAACGEKSTSEVGGCCEGSTCDIPKSPAGAAYGYDLLCYACRVSAPRNASRDAWPTYAKRLGAQVDQEERAERLRSQIQEFLLDDSDNDE